MMNSVRDVNLLEREEYSALSPSSTEASGALLYLLDGKCEVFVNAGSLIFFSSCVKGQQKQDILNSSLLAQLAANKKYDRFNDNENWYKFYSKVMGQLGWVMTQGFKFHKYQSSQTDFTISQMALELLSDMIEDETEIMTIVRKTLNSLTKFKSSDALTLFGAKSVSKQLGNFQVLVCDVDKSNQINVAVLFSYFHTSEVKKDCSVFTSQKTQDIAIFNSTEILTLNEESYAEIREEVKNKLGGKVDESVHNVAI